MRKPQTNHLPLARPGLILGLLLIVLSAACAPRQVPAPAASPIATAESQAPTATAPAATMAPEVTVPTEASTPEGSPAATTTPAAATTPAVTTAPAVATTPAAPEQGWKTYSDAEFGIRFEYPADWQGPDQYVSGSSLRLEIGSDVVYPYGTGPDERSYTVKNSYYVTIQYTKNNTNDFWKEAYQAVESLQDGQSSSGRRDLLICVGEVNAGRFHGYEYISTLSETAQTEATYARNVILIDDQNNLLTMMGTPNNVEVPPGAGWREVYQAVDEANAAAFHHIVETLEID